MARSAALLPAFVVGLAAPSAAVDAGKAVGSLTIDGAVIPLTVAVETRKENLFDEKKRDAIVVLTDMSVGSTSPDDQIGLAMRARRGDLAVVTLRLDGSALVNVTVSYKGLRGLV